MLPSQYRLPSSEIAHIAKTGKNIYSSELFFIKWIPLEQALEVVGQIFQDKSATEHSPNSVTNQNQPVSQWAISVGLKVSKSAVVRNRIKRLFRAAILQSLKYSNPSKFSGKFLIVARSNAISQLSSEEVFGLLQKIL